MIGTLFGILNLYVLTVKIKKQYQKMKQNSKNQIHMQ